MVTWGGRPPGVGRRTWQGESGFERGAVKERAAAGQPHVEEVVKSHCRGAAEACVDRVEGGDAIVAGHGSSSTCTGRQIVYCPSTHRQPGPRRRSTRRGSQVG